MCTMDERYIMDTTGLHKDYQLLLTEIIKEYIVILGPAITLAKVRNVAGVIIDDKGNVTSLSESPKKVIQNITAEFMTLSPFIAQKMIRILYT